MKTMCETETNGTGKFENDMAYPGGMGRFIERLTMMVMNADVNNYQQLYCTDVASQVC